MLTPARCRFVERLNGSGEIEWHVVAVRVRFGRLWRRAHGRSELLSFSKQGSGRWQDQSFIFASVVGTPLDPRNITRQFKALLKAAELPDIGLHDLRHSCATLLVAQGVNPRVIIGRAGYSPGTGL